MCRIFGIVGNSFMKKDNLVIPAGIISSWIESAVNDPILLDMCPQMIPPQGHPHGWGVITWSQDASTTTNFNLKRTNQPLVRSYESQIQQWVENAISSSILHFIGGHTRRASPNMPLHSLQVHPFVLDLHPLSSSLFLMHNGTADKISLNSLLEKPFSFSALQVYSDSQIMALLLKEHLLSVESAPTQGVIYDFMSKIVESHQEPNWSALQLILGTLPLATEELPKIWYVSCVNPLHRPDPLLCRDEFKFSFDYYKMYLGRVDSQYIFCSSTIKHYFEKGSYDKIKWQELPNFQIGEFLIDQKEIKLKTTSIANSVSD
ncbi:MAG: hypothetical protein ACFFCZ_17900 [Promethearchaeota archaeon]